MTNIQEHQKSFMDELIEKYLGYAHAIAAEVLKQYPYPVERSDVERAAELGLVQAARSYDPARRIAFTTFAYYRIRGAIYDDLRKSCRAAKFDEAVNEYQVEKSLSPESSPGHEDIYQEIRRTASSFTTSYLLSIDSLPREPEQLNSESPSDRVFRLEQQEYVREAMKQLPEKNREVLYSYYFEDLSFEEIGQKLGLSRSWVCRVHAKSLELLSKILKEDSVRLSAFTKSTKARAAQQTSF